MVFMLQAGLTPLSFHKLLHLNPLINQLVSSLRQSVSLPLSVSLFLYLCVFLYLFLSVSFSLVLSLFRWLSLYSDICDRQEEAHPHTSSCGAIRSGFPRLLGKRATCLFLQRRRKFLTTKCVVNHHLLHSLFCTHRQTYTDLNATPECQ